MNFQQTKSGLIVYLENRREILNFHTGRTEKLLLPTVIQDLTQGNELVVLLGSEKNPDNARRYKIKELDYYKIDFTRCTIGKAKIKSEDWKSTSIKFNALSDEEKYLLAIDTGYYHLLDLFMDQSENQLNRVGGYCTVISWGD